MADSQKQIVQWFPGHMAKTRRQIKECLPLVDAVAELLDARIPFSSANPELDEITGTKPRIILLNKCDMADENATKRWIAHFLRNGKAALAVDCRSGKGLNQFPATVKKVCAERIKRNEEKGMSGRPLRIMVVGIPNTGKSSFINRMAGRVRAKVADKPGVTRSNQWFSIGNGIELLDTPGVLWPKFDDPAVGDKLAFIGSVKDEILDSETIALRLLEALKSNYKNLLIDRYRLNDYPDDIETIELLEMIGKKRGFLARGGEIDTERTAVTILDEYRSGKLGKLTFELP